MKKNVNFFILGILIFTLMAMIGVAFYFNAAYESLNAKYENSLTNLKNLSRELNESIREVNEKNFELIQKEKTLIDIVNQLNLSEQKIFSLGEFYTKEKGAKEELTENLQRTEKERDFWKLNYSQTKQDLELLEKNYKIKESELRVANSRIDSLEVIINQVSSEINRLGGAEDTIEDASGKLNDLAVELDRLDDIINEVQGDIRTDLLEKAQHMDDLISDLKIRISKLKTNIQEMKESLKKA